MPRSIRQTVRFKDVSAKELFDIYMDAAKHAAAVKSEASVSKEVGGRFWVFGKDDGLAGRNLYILSGKMIVQTWRSDLFKKEDLDSVLTLSFSDTGDGAQIDLFHVNVPDDLYDNTNNGWRTYYWEPWKEYLKEKRQTKKSAKGGRAR